MTAVLGRGLILRGQSEPVQLTVGEHHDDRGGCSEYLHGAGHRGAAQPVNGLGGVDGQGHLGQRGQPGGRPLGSAPGPVVTQGGGDRGQEFVRFDRVRQVGVSPVAQAVGTVPDLHRGRRDLNDREHSGPRIGFDPLADVDAAQVWHTDIENYQVNAIEPGQRSPSGGGFDHGVASPPEPGGQDITLRLGIVGDEYHRGSVIHRAPPRRDGSLARAVPW